MEIKINKLKKENRKGDIRKMVDKTGVSAKMAARMKKEFDDLSKNTMGVTVMLDEKDSTKWNVFFAAPNGSVYDGGTFQLEITFPKTYPFNAPLVSRELRKLTICH